MEMDGRDSAKCQKIQDLRDIEGIMIIFNEEKTR